MNPEYENWNALVEPDFWRVQKGTIGRESSHLNKMSQEGEEKSKTFYNAFQRNGGGRTHKHTEWCVYKIVPGFWLDR